VATAAKADPVDIAGIVVNDADLNTTDFLTVVPDSFSTTTKNCEATDFFTYAATDGINASLEVELKITVSEVPPTEDQMASIAEAIARNTDDDTTLRPFLFALHYCFFTP